MVNARREKLLIKFNKIDVEEIDSIKQALLISELSRARYAEKSSSCDWDQNLMASSHLPFMYKNESIPNTLIIS
jgi:hypothetical protein